MICTVQKILEVKSGTTQAGDEYKTRDILLAESDVQYPNEFIANIFKKGEYAKFVDSLGFVEGDKVEVELKYKVKEYNGKFYQQVTVWNIKKVDGGSTEEVVYPSGDINPEDIPF